MGLGGEHLVTPKLEKSVHMLLDLKATKAENASISLCPKFLPPPPSGSICPSPTDSTYLLPILSHPHSLAIFHLLPQSSCGVSSRNIAQHPFPLQMLTNLLQSSSLFFNVPVPASAVSSIFKLWDSFNNQVIIHSELSSAYCFFSEGNPELLLKNVRDQNDRPQSWTRLCRDATPSNTLHWNTRTQ